jgi:hypothetical protein
MPTDYAATALMSLIDCRIRAAEQERHVRARSRTTPATPRDRTKA